MKNWFKKFTMFDESTTQTSSSTAPISETNKRTMKLSVKELREGNLIYQGKQYGIFPVSAYQIYQYSLYCSGAKVADYYSEWKSIELTEQWLKDLGYKENDKKFFKKTPYYIEYKDWIPEGFWMLKDIDIPIKLLKYVHSLQNLFFELTETELTK